MVLAKIKQTGKLKFLFIGLTETATNSLKAGKPIEITRALMGKCAPANWGIELLYGETEMDILNILESAMSKKTKLRLVPAAKKNHKPKKDHK